jgi:type II secretory pathway predicted ATPase ExeA/chromosome segregation ATPase
MEYEVRYGEGFALVLGEAGTGKSMIVRAFVRRLRPSDHAVVVTMPTAGHVNIVREIAKGFGTQLPVSPKTQPCLARLRKQLVRKADDETRFIVVIDQAENLSRENLIEIAAVSELRNQDRRLLSIVLAGQPGLMSLLNQPEFARLRQQAFTKRALEPLTLQQTGAYIRHRLEAAGATHAEIFHSQAVELIHQHAAGNPRIINRVCNAALVAAYGAERTEVDRALIQEVIEPRIRTMRAAGMEEKVGDRDARSAAPLPIAPSECTIVHRERPVEQGLVRSSSGGSHGPQDETCLFEATPANDSIRAGNACGGAEQVSESMTTSLVDSGEALVQRLELTIRHAEHIRVSHAATVQEQAAAEQRLQTLCSKAEGMLDDLSSSLQRATHSVERVERHAESISASCASRLDNLQERAESFARSAQESAERRAALEEATRRATEIESRLSRFAQDLIDRMEQAQEKTALMMSGLDTGEDVYNKLHEAAKDISSLTDECKAEVTRQREGLQEQIDEVQRLQHKVREEDLDAYRRQLEKVTADWRRTQFTSIKQEIARYQADLERLAQESTRHQTHLESLTEQSEAVGAKLTGIQQSFGPLDGLLEEKEKRVAGLHREAEEVSGTLDKAMASASDAGESLHTTAANANVARAALAAEIGQGNELLGRVNSACGDIERLQNTAADHLVQVGSACQRISAARDEAERCQDLLQQIKGERVEQQDYVADLAQQIRAKCEEEAHAGDEVIERLRAARLDEHHAAEQVVQSIKAQCAEQQASITRLAERLEATMQQAEEAGTRLIEAADQIEVRHQDAGMLLHRIDEKTGQLASHHAAANSLLHQLCDANVEGRDLLDSANATQEVLAERLEEIEHQTHKLCDEGRQTTAGVKSVLQEAEEAQERLRESNEQCTTLLNRALETHGQFEALQRSSASSLVEIGAACERAASLGAQATECVKIIDQLCATTDDGRDAHRKLAEAVADAHMAHEALKGLRNEAHEHEDVLKQREGEIQELLRRTTVASAQGQDLLQRMENRNETSEAKAAELARHHCEADALLENLNEARTSLETVGDGLADLITQADERTVNLETRTRQAGAMTERLTTISGLIESAEELTESLCEGAAKAESTREQLVEVLDQGRQQTQAMMESNEASESLIENHKQLSADAQETLKRMMDDAGAVMAELESQRANAQELLARLEEASTQGTRLNDELSESGVRADERIGRTEAAVDGIAARADELSGQLEGRAKEVSKAFATQANQLVEQLADRVERITGKMAKHTEAVSADRRALKEVQSAVQALSTHVHNLQAQATQLDEKMAQATARPREVISAAQAQAAQLETVCTAVRKVFAGLSRTTLDAQKQREVLDATGRDIEERLAALKTGTESASQALSQWVKEATHARDRLEETLTRCPTIRETHPGDALEDLSQTASGGGRAFPVKTSEGLQGITLAGHQPRAGSMRTLSQPVQNEEITQMIEEAKRSASIANE